MAPFYLTLAIFSTLGWWLEIWHRKKLESCRDAYNNYIVLLEKDRDEWKELAQGPRRIEGDEWKDG